MNEAELPAAWSDMRDVFEVDGSLRDIVVTGTHLDDWERAYDFVRKLVADGKARLETDPHPLPALSQIFALRAERSVVLSMHLGSVRVNCFFFDEEEIEFDVDPRDVPAENEARVVTSFMEGLAHATERQVRLTGEGAHDRPWLWFEPSQNAWTFDSSPAVTAAARDQRFIAD